jgi:hypothetical protein
MGGWLVQTSEIPGLPMSGAGDAGAEGRALVLDSRLEFRLGSFRNPISRPMDQSVGGGWNRVGHDHLIQP